MGQPFTPRCCCLRHRFECGQHCFHGRLFVFYIQKSVAAFFSFSSIKLSPQALLFGRSWPQRWRIQIGRNLGLAILIYTIPPVSSGRTSYLQRTQRLTASLLQATGRFARDVHSSSCLSLFWLREFSASAVFSKAPQTSSQKSAARTAKCDCRLLSPSRPFSSRS